MQEVVPNANHCVEERISPKNGEPSRITEQAQRLLTQHPYFRSDRSGIQLESDGTTLTISGRVSSYFRKQLLQEAFHSIKPIQRIDNQVVVAPER